MSYSITKPCNNCPFRRTNGAVRLRRERIREIAGMMLSPDGAEFPCHKTTVDDEDGERVTTGDSQHCAGALIFAEKNGNQTQMMRIAGRLRLYDPDKLEGRDDVFDTMAEMMKTAIR